MENVEIENIISEEDDMSETAKEPENIEKPGTAECDFPTSLEGFQYRFNEKGQLRHTESGDGFVFALKDDHQYNQKRYEALGEIITNYVYDLLENETKLKRTYIPVDAEEDEPRSFIFMSDDAMTNPDKLLILIHGSGVVRAGQWARRLIINDCLDSGTQVPFIKEAVSNSYGVMVLNTNLNSVTRDDGTAAYIRDSASPEEHAAYVWEHFVSKAAASHVAIIAHSYGGIVTAELAMKFEDDFEQRVFAIALTDSIHSLQQQDCHESTMLLYEKVAQNWVASDEPLDTPVPSFRRDCSMVSAGHPTHENTSWSSFKSIFRYLRDKYSDVTGADPDANKEEL